MLVSELDQERVLGQVLDAAGKLTGARYAALGVLDEAEEELERFHFVGIDDETRARESARCRADMGSSAS